jgi:putative copper export protein
MAEERTVWKSCCFQADRDSIRYFTQVGVLVAAGVFSGVMLIINPECNAQRNYSAILMMCLGVFLPTPKI